MTFTAAYKSPTPAWRNGLARLTSNPKGVGSTPTVGVIFCIAGYVLCSSNNSGRIIGVVQFIMHVLSTGNQLPWRNWLARSAVNRKVGGSSPPGDDRIWLQSPGNEDKESHRHITACP